MRRRVTFNREFLSDVAAAKKAGKSVDDVAMSWKQGRVFTTRPD